MLTEGRGLLVPAAAAGVEVEFAKDPLEEALFGGNKADGARGVGELTVLPTMEGFNIEGAPCD